MTSARDDQGVRRFVEQFALLLADWGFPRMAARVLLTLMAADEPGLTAVELGGRLDASPAAISGAVRYLVRLGLLTREPVPGSRSTLYVLPDNAWYAGAMREQDFFDQAIAAADKGVGRLGGPGTVAGARVAEMRDFFAFARQELAAILEKWTAQRGGHGAGLG